MKRILALALVASLSIPLAACNLGAVNSPSTIAGSITLDEKALAGAELAYQTAVAAADTAAAAGLFDTATKARVRQLDNQAFAALQAARAAYAAGNAASYATAVTGAMSALTDFNAAVHPTPGAPQ